MATIDAHYFRVCVRGAQRKGYDISRLYRRAGVRTERISSPGGRDSIDSMARLVRDIWTTLDDEFMGYTEHPVKRGAFAVMTEYAFQSDTVLDALHKGIEFYRVLTNDIVTTLEARKDLLVLEVEFRRAELDPDHYFMEFWLIIWHRLACWFAGETIPMLSADFSYSRPTDYLDEFKRLFPCPLRFDADVCRLTFHASDLLTPIRRTKSELKEMIARVPLELMTIPASDHSISRKVYVALRPWEQGVYRVKSADRVAAEIGMSSKSMRRALKAEGTSFRRVCEDIRRDLACSKLRRTTDSIESIASDLGYEELRSFTRAFRIWTGRSPSEYRRLERSDDLLQPGKI